MYCVNCGEALPKGVQVNACPACGADLRDINIQENQAQDNYHKGVLRAYLDSFVLKVKGGINIKEYWLATLLHLVVLFSVVFLGTYFSTLIYISTTDPLIEEISLSIAIFFIDYSDILGILISIPLITLHIRRMHDVGKSGWYSLIPIYSLILTLTPSLERNNPYR
jgi:uncharacterized membrane protein YhaH (DUF805 family)